MEKTETHIGSVRTLMKVLSELHDEKFAIFYRGHADKDYDVVPSIYRNPEWYTNEHKIVREIIMRCPNDFSNMNSSFEKLVKMQHYNLPTRLLDITENPLVAMFFACMSEDKKDGELLFFKVPKSKIKYYDSDTVSVLANVAWADSNFEIQASHRGSYKRFHTSNNIHASKLIHCIRQEKPYFSECINPVDIESVVCVKPKMDNQRVIRQDGAFFLFGINANKHAHAVIEDEWKYFPSEKRYIIKRSVKKEILAQLKSIGISKAKLFPEIDMVSQFIKENNELQFNEFSSVLPKPFNGQLLIV
ncbi:FRG domain-containing protein [Vibrio genomosp. F6]|uniref:FRG domain-containing protein n=1 Tax=Vibrio TaxID=662 RepID=UPI0010BD18A1|nr:FRG domain-containing protein [Vibrio genomosp. F6]TKF17751.1 FRG domain-containing protein [Vibrio genomosp. F6]